MALCVSAGPWRLLRNHRRLLNEINSLREWFLGRIRPPKRAWLLCAKRGFSGKKVEAQVSRRDAKVRRDAKGRRILMPASRWQEKVVGQVFRDLLADLGSLVGRVSVVHAAINPSIEHFVN